MTNNLEYNTQAPKLIIPEYGRRVQNMVSFALSIENREERNICARTIIGIMSNMFPQMKNIADFQQKLWGHLAIISDFQLDIDYPCPVPTVEEASIKPTPMEYPCKKIRFLHYGKYLEELIEKYLSLEEAEQRKQLLALIILQMKKSFSLWNKELMDDQKLIEDLRVYSKGRIEVTLDEIRDIRSMAPPPELLPKKRIITKKMKVGIKK